jgi:hypothetical protein
MRCPSKRSSTRSSPIAARHWMRRPELMIAGVARALKASRPFRRRVRRLWQCGGHRHGDQGGECAPRRRPGQGRPQVLSARRQISASARAGGFYRQIHHARAAPNPTRYRHAGMFGRSFFKQFHEAERTEVFSEVIELCVPRSATRTEFGPQITSGSALPLSGSGEAGSPTMSSPHPCQIHGRGVGLPRARRSDTRDAGSERRA